MLRFNSSSLAFAKPDVSCRFLSNNKKNEMSNLKNAIEVNDDKTKLIGHFLIDFYETMKMLEKDSQKGGKQATCIIMAINDLKEIINNESAKNL